MNYNRGLMFVDQLERVVSRGHNSWLACCPSHDDKSPSLSIKQLEDGRVLIHCHAGCSAQEVVESVGFNMNHLFPDETEHFKPLYQKKAQMTVDHWVIEIAKDHREQGKRLTKQDQAREIEAFKRLRARA
jgi:hypothetical protein